SVFLRHVPGTQPENIVNISSRTMQEFHGQMNLFQNELSRWEKANYSTIVVVDSEQRAEKVQAIFQDYGMEFVIQDKLELPAVTPTITVANLSTGIELPLRRLTIVTEQELDKTKTTRTRRTTYTSTNPERIDKNQQLKDGEHIRQRHKVM